MADLRTTFAGIRSPNPFWLASAPPGQRVQGLTLHGQPVGPKQALRVTVNSFMADGDRNDGLARPAGCCCSSSALSSTPVRVITTRLLPKGCMEKASP